MTPPSWLASIPSTAGVRVRPDPVLPLLAAALAGGAWVTVVVNGFGQLDPLWTVLALVTGTGALVLAARGLPGLGAIPLLAGIVCWGMATSGQTPVGFTDWVGAAWLLGWQLGFAVPLLAAFVACVWVDARRMRYLRIRAAMLTRNWWGAPGAAENASSALGLQELAPERQLSLLEVIPSARFVVARDGVCLVVAGRRAAVVRSAVWAKGDYVQTVDELLRNGRVYPEGAAELDAVADDVRNWSQWLADAGARCRGFLVVHPASMTAADRITLEPQQDGRVRLVHAADFVEVVGAHLAAEPHRIDVDVMHTLDAKLQLLQSV